MNIQLTVADTTVIKSIADHLLNGVETGLLKACIIAGYIGYTIYFLWTIQSRDPNSTHTPVEWSWSFFWRKNLFSIIRDMFTIPVVIVFYPQLLDVILTFLGQADLVPGWATKIFDTYNTTTVFTSLGVGVLWKIIVRRIRAWKHKRRAAKKEGS